MNKFYVIYLYESMSSPHICKMNKTYIGEIINNIFYEIIEIIVT